MRRVQRTKKKRNFLSLIFSLTGCMYAARRLSSDLVFSTYARNPDREEDSSASQETSFHLFFSRRGRERCLAKL